jgi:hypothetical protein
LAPPLRSHRPFLIALSLGALLRVLVQVAFPPAFIYSDGPMYLRLVDAMRPSPDRPVGYGVLLRVVSWATRDVWAVAVTQHVLGLLTAVVVYALLRRRGVSAGVATVATLPVLFDGMELVLEHSVLSDVLFDLVVLLGVAVLGWSRHPRVWSAAVAGALFGAAALIRVVGEPVVVAAVVFCLVAAGTLRARVVTAVVLCVAFLVPVTAYASWYHREHGVWSLSQSGKALYMRTTSFVDCSRLSLPSYERTLCPGDPLGQRQDPTYYGWHDPTTVRSLHPPAGVSRDDAMRDFALRAIRAQPWAYVRTAARDFAMTFSPVRGDYYGYDTAYKWSFAHYVDYQPTPYTGPAYASHGGEQPTSLHPLADVLSGYGRVVYVRGPLVLAMLLTALAGLVTRRPRAAAGTRPLVFLCTALAMGLVLVPDLTAEFTWRYQVPELVLLPVAAALGWTRLLGTGVSRGPRRRRRRTDRTAG